MKDKRRDPSQLVARRVARLRASQRLSLDALARRSGVSRSMISLIERGESSPTAAVLSRLAAALGVPMASLFEPNGATAGGDASAVARRKDQPLWQDPASGYRRRNVSPPGMPQPMRIVEVDFPPGGRVAFETGDHRARIHQQIWLLEGAMDITLGAQRHRLRAGDCLAMELDGPNVFHNPTRKPARYALVTSSEENVRRR